MTLYYIHRFKELVKLTSVIQCVIYSCIYIAHCNIYIRYCTTFTIKGHQVTICKYTVTRNLPHQESFTSMLARAITHQQ